MIKQEKQKIFHLFFLFKPPNYSWMFLVKSVTLTDLTPEKMSTHNLYFLFYLGPYIIPIITVF